MYKWRLINLRRAKRVLNYTLLRIARVYVCGCLNIDRLARTHPCSSYGSVCSTVHLLRKICRCNYCATSDCERLCTCKIDLRRLFTVAAVERPCSYGCKNVRSNADDNNNNARTFVFGSTRCACRKGFFLSSNISSEPSFRLDNIYFPEFQKTVAIFRRNK